jgi:hypothetical protein
LGSEMAEEQLVLAYCDGTVFSFERAHLNLGPRLFDIPLIYGMCYDGCDIEMRKMSPTQSSDGWPYPHFPALLPYVPLRVGDTRRCTYAEFAEAFPNMPEVQGYVGSCSIRSIARRYLSMRCRSRSDGAAIRDRSQLSCRSASLTRRPMRLAAARRTNDS